MSDSWPKKWMETELGNVAVAVTGCTYEQFDFPQDDLYPFNTIHDISDDRVKLKGQKYIRISEREKVKFKFKKGDIVFNYRSGLNQLGKTAVFDLDDTVIHTSKYFRIRPVKEYDGQFLEFIFRLYKSEGRFKELVLKNAKFPSISLSQLKNLKVPVPPFEKQRQIADGLSVGFDKLNALKIQVELMEAALGDYRRRIADLAVSGKLIGVNGFRHRQLGEHLEGLNAGVTTKPGQDILMLRAHVDHALVGQSMIAEDDPQGYVYPAAFMRIRARHTLHPSFLNIILNSSPVRDQLVARANSTSRGYRIGMVDVQALCIPVPSWTEQSELMDHVNVLMHRVDLFDSEYQDLKKELENFPKIMLARGLRGDCAVMPDSGPFENLLSRIQSKSNEVALNETEDRPDRGRTYLRQQFPEGL